MLTKSFKPLVLWRFVARRPFFCGTRGLDAQNARFQASSEHAFPSPSYAWSARSPCFAAFPCLEALLAAEPEAWMLKTRVSKAHWAQVCWEAAFSAPVSEPLVLPRPCWGTGSRIRAASAHGVRAMKHRQAQVEPLSRVGSQRRRTLWTPGNGGAQAASTGRTFRLMAIKRNEDSFLVDITRQRSQEKANVVTQHEAARQTIRWSRGRQHNSNPGA